MAESRRPPTNSRRRSSSRRSSWCCSFAVPPASPDIRFPVKSPQNPNPSFSKPSRPIIDARRILSPGRVSPIDSDPPSLLPPLPKIPEPEAPEIRVMEAPAEDLRRIRVSARDGGSMVIELDPRVLCENSRVFRRLVAESGNGEVEVGEVEDLGVFRETMEMMYAAEEEVEGEELGFIRLLARAGVSRSIDVLEVSSKIMFDRGVTSCLNYIEAVPWSENEEEKLKSLFARCTFDKTLTKDILARLHPNSPSGSGDLAVQLIQSVADGSNGSARKELQTLVTGLLSKSSVYRKEPSGLNNERIYSICNSCIDSLTELFEEASDSSSKQSNPLVPRISKQVENLNWLLEILIDRHIAEDFIYLWANQKKLVDMHKLSSPMVRYELSRISANVFIALGKGKLRCPGDIRFAVLETWFEPLMVDFGWLQRCSKGLDMKTLEECLGQAILTLPLKQQQRFFVEWFRCFGGKGTDCPNLSNAFQVWWRRAFVRTADSRNS